MRFFGRVAATLLAITAGTAAQTPQDSKMTHAERGVLNAHQWLLYIPLHHLRHNMQIAEVKTLPDYPR